MFGKQILLTSTKCKQEARAKVTLCMSFDDIVRRSWHRYGVKSATEKTVSLPTNINHFAYYGLFHIVQLHLKPYRLRSQSIHRCKFDSKFHDSVKLFSCPGTITSVLLLT